MAKVRNILISVADITSNYLAMLRRDRKNYFLFLDSGAFSILSNNFEMTVKQYIEFCHTNGSIFDIVAALDVIGNAPESYSNYMEMLDAGLKDCVPTWHIGEPIEYIAKYLKHTDYIAIGGLAVKQRVKNKMARATAVNSAIHHVKQVNKDAKIHLFGMTSVSLLKQFGPKVYSVDSTTWMQAKNFGALQMASGRRISYKGRVPTDYNKFSAFNCGELMRLEGIINEYCTAQRS